VLFKVNQMNKDMKHCILEMLQTASSPVSGEKLSQVLGISRVAVWKHIKKMQSAGCLIEAGPTGYRLITLSDAPFPWMFGSRSSRIHHYSELPSTMDKALELAQSGCDNFSVVVADLQTRGRGRLQRHWQSELGGLYFSMVLRPQLALQDGPLINMAAALDLAETLNTLYGITAKVKWPNDVLVNEHKMAGILSQMSAEVDRIHFICLGIGLNVNNRPPDNSPKAASVAQLIGRPGSRTEILSFFLDCFEQRLGKADLSQVIPQWKQKTVTLGRTVVVQTLQETIEGMAVDLDPQGGLILALPDGNKRTVVYGDCFHGN
jgi:BirA family biotin operon repressor/biotin-[acetyl-CoA-carboxylase] ligase